MNKHQYWKNFNLGIELSISGRFVYNGLEFFHLLRNFAHEDEIFEVLYNLAVGLERLAKIAVVLLEHDEHIDQDDFDRSLITHSHADLIGRVIKAKALKLSPPHHELLSLLGSFYKSHRYARYNSGSITATGREKVELLNYIEKYLKIGLTSRPRFFAPQNTPQIKAFIGRTVGGITSQLYETIEQRARELNIFTYELRYHTKAYKIFAEKDYEFKREDTLTKELLLAIGKYADQGGHIGALMQKEALPFDFGSGTEHLSALLSNERKLEILDELESLYEELDKPGERVQFMSLIGDPSVDFGDEIDDDNPFGSSDDDDDVL